MSDKTTEDLIKEYLGFITQDHHKDRDCHFSIEKRWKYGECVGYRVVHDGYCHSEISDFFTTASQAEEHLRSVLIGWVEEESTRTYD